MQHTTTYRRRGPRGAFLLVAEPAPPPAARPRLLMLVVLLASLGLAVAAGQPHSAGATAAFAPPTVTSFDPAPPSVVRKLIQGDTARPEIALTFDDGPNPATTRLLLALLRIYRVRATFFVIGDNVRLRPELVREMRKDGHAIGNHTGHHARLCPLDTEQVWAEVADGDAALRRCGVTTRLFRPPGGGMNPRILDTVNAMGYTTVLWTVNPGDYTRPGVDVIERRVLDRVRNGSIILLHDGCEQTLTALPRLLQALTERGYRFVTVEEMLAHQDARAEEPRDELSRLFAR